MITGHSKIVHCIQISVFCLTGHLKGDCFGSGSGTHVHLLARSTSESAKRDRQSSSERERSPGPFNEKRAWSDFVKV